MKKRAIVPNARTTAYDMLNKLIDENLSNKTFYRTGTDTRYRIMGIETSLYGRNYFIKLLNLNTNKFERIKNNRLKDLELVTKENHP